jgi:diaminopimelate epimerase
MKEVKFGNLEEEYAAVRSRTLEGFKLESLGFSIMHGNGNVILVLDAGRSKLPDSRITESFARKTCESFSSLRIDGISFVKAKNRQVRMTFFDRDGTKEPMCGNGLRCSALYAYHQRYIPSESLVKTDDGEKWVSVAGGVVCAGLGPGREFRKLDDDRYFVFSAVPHLVVFTRDLDSIDVRKRGAELRYDKNICKLVNHPEGVHVDFVKVGRDDIRIRTYEVGVEDETLSCGTGAAGAAFVVNRVERLSFPIVVKVNCGEIVVSQNKHGLVISGVVRYLFSNVVTGIWEEGDQYSNEKIQA